MPAYIETAEDLSRKFQGCFVLYKGVLAAIHSFLQLDETRVNVNYRTDDNAPLLQEVFDAAQISTLNFDSKYYNIPTDVCKQYELPCMGWKFVRKSRRQNRRSLSHDTAYLNSFLRVIYAHIGRYYNGAMFSFATVKPLLNPTYPRFPYEAFELCREYVSVAISPDFALSLSPIHSDKYLLLSKFGFIGTATLSRLEVFHRGSYQEVYDFIRRSNLNVDVQLCQ